VCNKPALSIVSSINSKRCEITPFFVSHRRPEFVRGIIMPHQM
jgi:hypothetical protein